MASKETSMAMIVSLWFMLRFGFLLLIVSFGFSLTEFKSLPGAAGYQLSNPPLLQTVALIGSLNVFAKTTIKQLRAKSDILTAYLEILLLRYYGKSEDHDEKPAKQQKLENGCPPRKENHVSIITPINPVERGCQLSVKFSVPIKSVHEQLEKRGIVVDTREPHVMRISPVPLYNSFEDVHRFVSTLREVLEAVEPSEAEPEH